MIVVDTSALLAVVLDEAGGPACRRALNQADAVCISAGTLAEALIVAGYRDVEPMLSALLDDLKVEVVALGAQDARDVAESHRRWGKGVHPARLNPGDCFAYALARTRGAPLLYIGDDFSRTDIASALA